MSLQLVVSNRYEFLKTAYLSAIARAKPFQNRLVIIPNAAVERDIRLAEAAKYKISMGVEFDFFSSWVIKLAKEHGISGVFNSENLTEQIFSYLNDKTIIKNAHLQQYLIATDQITHYYFAENLANIFSRYFIYRASWLEQWSVRSEEKKIAPQHEIAEWQADIWNYLLKKQQIKSWQAVTKKIIVNLDKSLLPEQINIFCTHDYTDEIQELIIKLAEIVEVKVFFISPCREFWGDNFDKHLLKKQLVRQSNQSSEAYGNDFQFLLGSQEILNNWSKPTQYFWQRWLNYSEYQEISLYYPYDEELPRFFPLKKIGETKSEVDQFEESSQQQNTKIQQCLLNHLQNNWLNYENKPYELLPSDKSLLIHSCHSVYRQVEICYQQILLLLSENEHIQADEVLVITPQLNKIAPLITAIWDSYGQIPYQISGQNSISTQIQQLYLDLLELLSNEITTKKLINILRNPLIARKFQLEITDVDNLQQILLLSLISGESNSGKNSWESGFSKLFLGFATDSSENMQIFTNSIAASGLSGKLANAYGGLWSVWQIYSKLQKFSKEITSSIECWQLSEQILQLTIISDKTTITEKQQLSNISWQVANNLAGEISWELFSTAIKSNIKQDIYGGVANGKIMVSNLSSFRYLPYKAIYILGLENNIFPQQNESCEYDLLGKYPKYGDQQRVDLDKNLFVDLIVAARQHLSIFYIGKEQRSLQEQTPSPLISDLIKMIKSFVPPAQETQILIEHCLNGYAFENFTKKTANNHKLNINYDQKNFNLVKILQNNKILKNSHNLSLVNTDILYINQLNKDIEDSCATNQIIEIKFTDLAEFYIDSARYWLKKQCTINIWDEYSELSEFSELKLSKDNAKRLKQQIYDFFTLGGEIEQIADLLNAMAELPTSDIYSKNNDEITRLVKEIHQYYQKVNKIKLKYKAKETIKISSKRCTYLIETEQFKTNDQSLVEISLDEKFNIKKIFLFWLKHLLISLSNKNQKCSYYHTFKTDKSDIYYQNDKLSYEILSLSAKDATEYLINLCEVYIAHKEKVFIYPLRTAWLLQTVNEKSAEEAWYKEGSTDIYGESQYSSWKLVIKPEQLSYSKLLELNKIVLRPLELHLKKAENNI